MLNPVLQRVFQAEKGADLMKINTDNEQDIAAKYKVNIPTPVSVFYTFPDEYTYHTFST